MPNAMGDDRLANSFGTAGTKPVNVRDLVPAQQGMSDWHASQSPLARAPGSGPLDAVGAEAVPYRGTVGGLREMVEAAPEGFGRVAQNEKFRNFASASTQGVMDRLGRKMSPEGLPGTVTDAVRKNTGSGNPRPFTRPDIETGADVRARHLAADTHRQQWQSEVGPKGLRGLMTQGGFGDNTTAIDAYNREQDTRGTGIRMSRGPDGVMSFTNIGTPERKNQYVTADGRGTNDWTLTQDYADAMARRAADPMMGRAEHRDMVEADRQKQLGDYGVWREGVRQARLADAMPKAPLTYEQQRQERQDKVAQDREMLNEQKALREAERVDVDRATQTARDMGLNMATVGMRDGNWMTKPAAEQATYLQQQRQLDGLAKALQPLSINNRPVSLPMIAGVRDSTMNDVAWGNPFGNDTRLPFSLWDHMWGGSNNIIELGDGSRITADGLRKVLQDHPGVIDIIDPKGLLYR